MKSENKKSRHKPFNPLSENHCKWTMYKHLKNHFRNKYSNNIKYPNFNKKRIDDLEIDDLKLEVSKIEISEDNLEGLIDDGYQHKQKNNVSRFKISYLNPISKQVHKDSLNVLAKTSEPYKPDRKENIRNESESLKLLNSVYPMGYRKLGRKKIKINPPNEDYRYKIIPQHYTYDPELSVLFREYIEGKSLTKIILNARKFYMDEPNREIANNISANIDHLMKSVIETLAEIHEDTTNHAELQKFNIKRPDAYSHAYDFSNLVMELSSELEKNNKIPVRKTRDEYYKEELINKFLSSPLGQYLNSDTLDNKRFIIGDYFSDNILIDNMEDIYKTFSSRKRDGFWKKHLRVIDLGKCQYGPVQFDLNDLLNEPYPGFRKLKVMDLFNVNYTKDGILGNRMKHYVDYKNLIMKERNKTKRGYRDFKRTYHYCSVLRLMKQRVNERYDQFKPGFIKRLNDTLTSYSGFDSLKETLDRRNLLDVSKHYSKK